MCGIAGIYGYGASASRVNADELLRIRDAMVSRGPDGAGIWLASDGRAGLAHRRLSIIDLSEAGAQPMSAADGRLHVVFNGEIYNYRELRQSLEAQGRRFFSTSDTEVLLHLYSLHGARMVQFLRGMYAFAIFDKDAGELFLARDPFGIKPLYYSDDGATFRFASQVKALVKGDGVDTSPCAAGHVGFYLWGHVPDPHTLFKGVRALPAGSSLLVSRGECEAPKTFFDVTAELAQAAQSQSEISEGEAAQRLHAALRESVRYHLVADVPVGLFLSAGLDSTVLTALAVEAQGGSNLRTMTLGFEEYRGTDNDETPLAEATARHYGTAHETRWVSGADFDAALGELLEAMDQPSIDGVNTYFVSRAAAQAGMKVALSGLGGDELFGGYSSFRRIPRIVDAFRLGSIWPALGTALRRVSAPALQRLGRPKMAGLLEYGGTYGGAYLLRRGLFMPWELTEFLDHDLVKQGWEDLQTLPSLARSAGDMSSGFQKICALELSWYMRNRLLRDSDWAGMAHSLEIRVPLVDIELFRVVAPLTARRPPTKLEMASAPSRPLPAAVLSRKKTGFSIPVEKWLRRTTGGDERGLRPWSRRV